MHPRATKHPSVGAVVLDAARVSSILDKFGLSIFVDRIVSGVVSLLQGRRGLTFILS